MKSRYISLFSILTVFLLLISCKQSSKPISQIETSSELKYAELFSIDQTNPNYTKVLVYNPWNNRNVYHTYYLVRNEEQETPSDGIKIQIPVTDIVTTSATQVGFIDLLGELGQIKGITDIEYVYNPFLLEQFKAGNIQNLGQSFNINTENLLLLNPNILFTTAYNGDNSEADKMKRLNQKPVYNLEWQESTLLGRAEWIKFIGIFFDKSKQADSIFNEIEQNYLQAKEITASITEEPTILSGQDFRGAWALPSGTSYAAQLFKDAKVDYYYKDETQHQASIPSSIEEALVYFHDADLWINVNSKTFKDLEAENDKYSLFKAFKNKNVYNNSKRSNPNGGNDYWESGIARPDLLLMDLIKIAHPELLKDYELTYMQKLK